MYRVRRCDILLIFTSSSLWLSFNPRQPTSILFSSCLYCCPSAFISVICKRRKVSALITGQTVIQQQHLSISQSPLYVGTTIECTAGIVKLMMFTLVHLVWRKSIVKDTVCHGWLLRSNTPWELWDELNVFLLRRVGTWNTQCCLFTQVAVFARWDPRTNVWSCGIIIIIIGTIGLFGGCHLSFSHRQIDGVGGRIDGRCDNDNINHRQWRESKIFRRRSLMYPYCCIG
jgi:hypothetical protein